MRVACWKLGQQQAAVEAFEDSRRLNPSLLEPVYNLGVIQADAGDGARAARLLGVLPSGEAEESRARVAARSGEKLLWLRIGAISGP